MTAYNIKTPGLCKVGGAHLSQAPNEPYELPPVTQREQQALQRQVDVPDDLSRYLRGDRT